MAEPFVFHFSPGPSGRPEIMYILDLDCQCGLCGYEQFQRFYHSTPFHRLTLAGLEDLIDRGPLKASYECENCGEAVGANQVRNAALIYGFCDDSGVLRIFDDIGDGGRRWEVTGCRRLDPQVVPRWEADPAAFSERHRALDDLHEQDVQELLGRPFNLKLAIRDLLLQWTDNQDQPLGCRLTDDFWIAIASDQQQARDVDFDRDCNDHCEGNRSVIALHDSRPEELPFHGDASHLAGRWSTWLPAETQQALSTGQLWIDIHLSSTAAIHVIERTFEVGRLEFVRRDGDETVFSQIKTPRGTVFDHELGLQSVLQRAAFTGITPGEAGRLCGEEIVGGLLGIW